MTRPADDDDEDLLPELAPLDTDDGAVEVPDELPAASDEALDDDEVVGVDPRAVVLGDYGDEAGEDGDAGAVDDPLDALPDDDRGGWTGEEERPIDDVAEIVEPTSDVPDGGEDGPTRDPYDEVDTALPSLDDGDDDGEAPVEGSA